jgi:hypothetical protein
MLASIIQTPGVSHFFGCRPMGPIGWGTAIGASVVATRLAPRVSRVLDPDRGPLGEEEEAAARAALEGETPQLA